MYMITFDCFMVIMISWDLNKGKILRKVSVWYCSRVGYLRKMWIMSFTSSYLRSDLQHSVQERLMILYFKMTKLARLFPNQAPYMMLRDGLELLWASTP